MGTGDGLFVILDSDGFWEHGEDSGDTALYRERRVDSGDMWILGTQHFTGECGFWGHSTLLGRAQTGVPACWGHSTL